MIMKLVKVKITKEFRNGKPAIWVNAYVWISRLGNGNYQVISHDGNYRSIDKFDTESRSFYTRD